MKRFRILAYGAALILPLTLRGDSGESTRAGDRVQIIAVERTDVERGYVEHLKSSPPRHRAFLYDPKTFARDAPPNGGPIDGRDVAQKIVTKRLAPDGLPSTLVAAIEMLGPELFTNGGAESLAILRSIGLPIDWLPYFHLPGQAPDDAATLIARLARLLADGASTADVQAAVAALQFSFRPSHANLCIAPESGNSSIRLMRLQLPTVDYWRGPGDGSAADVARQLCNALDDADLLICLPMSLAMGFAEAAGSWPSPDARRMTLLAGDWTPQQWAQDNGKPAWIADAAGGHARLATLVSRYANRGEERSAFDLDETLIAAALSKAQLAPIRSPLLFQGGNLLVAQHPTTGRRTLLLGEAEIYRNTAMGLAAEQVVAAFRIEAGADECVVLPAVSFHIDVDLCVRAHDGGLIAFVNDEIAAARLILKASMPAMIRAGTIDDAAARRITTALDADQIDTVLETLGPALKAATSDDGAYALQFANHFAHGQTDSGPANLKRVLLAMDILASRHITPAEMPPDPPTAAFIAAFQRRAADRAAQQAILERLGWKVVPVPSTSDETISVNYVNGFHEPDRYLMPAYGGLFTPVDNAAKRAFEATLGAAVEIVPVHCGETQRRLGAIHCAASAYYLPKTER